MDNHLTKGVNKVVATFLLCALFFVNGFQVWAGEAEVVESEEAQIIEESQPVEQDVVEEEILETENSSMMQSSSMSGGQVNDYHPEREPLKAAKDVAVDPQTGALSYEYPIIAPPGRLGIEPNLALSYNSQNLDVESIVGMGWSLNIPYIERIPRKGVNKLYSENYFYSSLSGEIVPIDLVGVSAGLYGAKVEGGDFLNYELNEQNQWIVKNKNGLVYKFGVDAGSRQDAISDSGKIYKWMLKEIRDMNNNFITYEYEKSDGQIYPSKIVYTGNGSQPGAAEVVFNYEGREDKPRHFDTGFEVLTDKRLASVETKFNGDWTRKYELDYGVGVNGSVSLLTNIVESGRSEDGNVLMMPAVEFGYQDAEKGFTKDENYTVPDGFYFYDSTGGDYLGTTTADVNGDALDDLVLSANASNGHYNIRTFLNKGDGSGWFENPAYDFPEYLYQHSSNEYQGVKVSDVNGDNLPDILKSYGLYKKIYLNKGDEAGWEDIGNQYQIPLAFAEGENDSGVRLFDANSDGLTDLIQSIQYNFPTTRQGVYINNGNETGWTKDESYVLPPVYFMDQNSDIDRGTYVTDVNGDGLPDILRSAFLSQNNILNDVYLNKGDGGWFKDSAYQIPIYLYQGNSNEYKGVQIVDVNGDGLGDLVQSSMTSSRTLNRVFINAGDSTGWVEDMDYELPVYLYSDNDAGPFGEVAQGVRLIDVDGDGLEDILQAKRGSGATVTRGVYINDQKSPNLLTNIHTVGGAATEVVYQPTTAYKVGTELANAKLPIRIYTIANLTTDDGFGNLATTTYNYERGEYFFNNPNDRKFAGFAKVTEVDDFGNETVRYFHQGNDSAVQMGENQDNKSKINMVYREEFYDDEGALFTRKLNKWDSTDLGDERNFVRIGQTLVQTFDGNSTHRDVAESYVYDLINGNLTQQTAWGEVVGAENGTFSDSGSDKIVTDFTYALKTDGSASGLISKQLRKNQAGSKVGETNFYYDDLALNSVSKGNLTKEEQWVAGTQYVDVERVYNRLGLVTEERDHNDNKTLYTYDGYGLYPATVKNALGHVNTYSYDYSSGQILDLTNANGHHFLTRYDAFDRKIEEKQPDEDNPSNLVTKSAYAYNDTAFPRKITTTNYLDANNNAVSVQYLDGFDRVVQERRETEDAKNWAVRDFKYNARGLLDREALPYFAKGSNFAAATNVRELYTGYEYDAVGRVVEVVNALGTTENFYDDWGLTTYDALGNKKFFAKDAFGRLVEVKEYNNDQSYSTKYVYDSNGNLTKIGDPQKNLRNFTYDALGRQLSAEDLHANNDTVFGKWFFEYDAAGNLIKKTTPEAQVINYRYDKLNRVTSESLGSAVAQSYVYDNCGNGVGLLCSATVASHNTISSYGYWPSGMVKTEVKQSASLAPQTTMFTYDRAGNLTRLEYPDQNEVAYSYDVAGMLEKVLLEGQELVSSHVYNPMGQIETQKLGNGTDVKYSYDANKLYRLTQKLSKRGTTELQNLHYQYDAVGNILQIAEQANIGLKKTADYTYDDLYRLTEAEIVNGAGQSYVETYQYDAIGNILNKSNKGQYKYEGNVGSNFASPHAVTKVATQTYNYDKNGNLAGDGSWTHLWDHNNRLWRSSDGVRNFEYFYDYQGNRVGKMGVAPHVTSTDYYVNDYYDLEDGGVAKHHIYAGKQKIATMSAVSGPHGILTSELVYHLTDHLSGSSVEVRQDGVVLQILDYYPFGGVRVDENGNSTYENNYKFTGHELDAETGLYYANARYYNADIGRFVSVDPWEGDYTNPQSLNKYAYVMNNPVKYVDPSGEFFDIFLDIAVGLYDAGKAAKNFAETAYHGTGLVWNTVTGNTEKAVSHANAYDKNVDELADSAVDLGIDAGAAFIPFVPAVVGKVDNVVDAAKPIWTKGKFDSSVQNAWGHFKKHGNDFPEIYNAQQYVEKAKYFMQNSLNKLSHTSKSGDKLFYDISSNTFGVMNKSGVPKTLYKPDLTKYGGDAEKFWIDKLKQ